MSRAEQALKIIEDVRNVLSEALNRGVDSAVSKYKGTFEADTISSLPPNDMTVAILDTFERSVSVVFNCFLAELKRKRNMMTTLGKLSDDILSKTFLFAAQNAVNVHEKIKLSHVCNRWRTVIINDARLWTNVDFLERRAVVDECLRRARQAPLHLRQHWSYDLGGDFVGGIVQVFQERHAQVRSLSVAMPVDQVLLATQLVAHPLPIAHTFNVTMSHGGWGEDLNTNGPWVNNLFQGEAPLLEYLCLHKLGLPWTLAKFSTLTSLILEKCYFANSTKSCDFVTVLECLPFLEQLSLVDCSNLCYPGSLFTRVVKLPDLRVARLEVLKPSDTVHILSTISTNSSLRLTCSCRFGEDDAVSLFSDVRLPHLESLQTVQDLCIDVTHVEMRAVETVSLTGSRFKASANKNVIFILSGEGTQWVEQSFPAVCDPFDLSGLKRLSVNWRSSGWSSIVTGHLPLHDAAADLAYFLRRCPDLESISLSGWSNSEFLDVFVPEDRGVASLTRPCPKLHTIHLENSAVTEERLKKLILNRNGCEKIRSLTLKGCYTLNTNIILWLRVHIEDVFCDSEANEIAVFEDAP